MDRAVGKKALLLALTLAGLGGCGAVHKSGGDGGTCAVAAPEWGYGGELMLSGTDCFSCHKTGGHATTLFSVAGTIFDGKQCATPVTGAVVHVRDSVGASVDLPTNDVGNFQSNAVLKPPLTVSIEAGGVVRTMSAPVSTGSCGSCHGADTPVGYVALH